MPKKKRNKKAPKKQSFFQKILNFFRRKKPDVGKIYKTTDGYFNNNPHAKKDRRVVVVEQRKDDKAVAVAKIASKAGKEEKIGKYYIPDLTLKPQKHSSLTEDSIVSRRVHISVKKDKKHTALYTDGFYDTKDKLSKSELKKVQKGVQNDNPSHRKTHKNTIKKWKKHFKE